MSEDNQTVTKPKIIIEPTVGRIVHYHEEFEDFSPENQPLAAIITYVHGQRSVNLCVYQRTGQAYGVTNIKLIQDGDILPPISERYCYWPVQVIEGIRQNLARKVDSPNA